VRRASSRLAGGGADVKDRMVKTFVCRKRGSTRQEASFYSGSTRQEASFYAAAVRFLRSVRKHLPRHKDDRRDMCGILTKALCDLEMILVHNN